MSTKKTTTTKIISERLKLLLDESGIKKGVLAKNIGVSAGMITQLLSGESGASPRTIKSIAREFSVSEEWLEYGTGNKNCHYEVRSIYIPQPPKTEHSSMAETVLDITDKLTPEGRSKALKAVMEIFISEQTKEK